jgi:aldose 1-epimerase
MTVADVTRRPFGRTPAGEEVEAFDLALPRPAGEVRVTVITWGARLQSVRVPDRDGTPGEVTLGYDDLDGYLQDTAFLGATVGRFANRVAGGRFTLDGVEHRLPQNEGGNTLHGGPGGFHGRTWQAEVVPGGVELRLRSEDGDMGFPGALDVVVRLTLSEVGLRWDYCATCDAPTVLNLTNHAYWNLRGPGRGTVEDHVLRLRAGRYLPVDEQSVPTGDPAEVAGTVMDFRAGARVGERLRAPEEQLRRVGGYDHCYLLDGDGTGGSDGLPLAATVLEPTTGRVLELRTDQPGLQVYSGNKLDGSVAGRAGTAMRQGDGLCLETQHLPDSPNHPSYPSTVLRPGETFATSTVVAFGTA